MTHIRLDRRNFLFAGAAAAGAAVLARPLRAFGSDDASAAGSFALAKCTDALAWDDLSVSAIAAVLKDPRTFALGAPDSGPALKDAPTIGLLGGSLSPAAGLDTVQFRIEYPGARPDGTRQFTAMILHPGDSPGGVLCRVPLTDGLIRLSIVSTTRAGEEVVQRLAFPARRGVYALALGGRATSSVKWNEGVVSSDWPCCALLTIADAPAQAAK